MNDNELPEEMDYEDSIDAESEEVETVDNPGDNSEVEEIQTPAVRPVLSKMQEAEMFKSLTHKSYKQAGMDFGLHHFYREDSQVRTAVLNIVRKIRKAPTLWGLTDDIVEVVDEAINSRNLGSPTNSDLAIQQEGFKDRLDAMRDKTADMIMKKLEKYDTKKNLDNVSLKDLKDLLSVAIDKSRLLRGESTENITNRSKIDTKNLSPQDALAIVMKARDALIESKK